MDQVTREEIAMYLTPKDRSTLADICIESGHWEFEDEPFTNDDLLELFSDNELEHIDSIIADEESRWA